MMENRNKEELLMLLKQLIEIPSITGSDAVGQAIQFVRTWLEKEGIQTKVIISHGVPNLIAKVGDSGKVLLWNSHVDVVPSGDYEHWNHPPFIATEENGYICGRGTSDAKSGLAAMMYALKLLREKQLSGQICLMVSGAEETGSENGTVAMLNACDQIFDAAIVAEPSDMNIEIAQRGLRWLELRVHGIASHGARPYLGVNAISQCGKIMEALEKINFNDKNPLFEKEIEGTTISVNKIHGGIQNNIIPEECRMVLDCRMMPGQEIEEVYQQIQNAAKQAVDRRCQLEYNNLGNGWDSFVINEKEPIVQIMQNAYEKVHGQKTKLRGKSGCTDASYIYNHNIPVVVFGPGDPNESHRVNEKVCVKNIEEMVEILCESAKLFMQKENIMTNKN